MTALRHLGSYDVHGAAVEVLCLYSGGDRLASVAVEWDEEEREQPGILKVWTLEAGVQAAHRDLDALGEAAVSPDGKLLVWGCMQGQLRILDGETGSLLNTISVDEGRRHVSDPLFTPDSKHLLTSVGSGSDDPPSVVNVWEVSSWRRLFALRTGWVYSLSLSADGHTLAVGLVDGGVQLWDLAARKQLLSIPAAHGAQVRSVAIDPGCKWLASTCPADALKLWDLSDNPPSCRVLQEETLGGGCTAVAFLPTGELLSGDEPGELRVWDVVTGRAIWRHSVVEGFPDLDGVGVTALAVSADGSKVAVGTSEGGVSLYAVETRG